MRKSKLLLTSAILGSLYLIYIVYYFSTAVAGSSGTDQLGAGIATALVTPHMFVLALAVLFNWIGWAIKAPWAALTGAILYCVSALLFLLYAVFELPSIVLSFVGFAKMRNAKRAGEPREPHGDGI